MSTLVQNVAIAAALATILSLLLEWFPGLAAPWEALSGAQRQGIMAALVMVVSIATVIVNCSVYTQCPPDWLQFITQSFLAFIAAAAGNQGVHNLTKKR